MFLYLLLTRKNLTSKRCLVVKPSLNSPLPIEGRILQIKHPPKDERARKVVTRSGSHVTGKYPSWKMGRMIQFESVDERNVFRMLDVSPEYSYFQEQPLKISYVLNGEEHFHIPDVLVHSRTHKELWEIKPSYYANDPDVIARTALMTAALPALGYQYKMVLAEDLRNSVRLANAGILLDHQVKISTLDREHLRTKLNAIEVLTWGDIVEGALGPNGRAHACRLIVEGVLHIDLDQHLTKSTRILQSNQSVDVFEGAQA